MRLTMYILEGNRFKIRLFISLSKTCFQRKTNRSFFRIKDGVELNIRDKSNFCLSIKRSYSFTIKKRIENKPKH